MNHLFFDIYLWSSFVGEKNQTVLFKPCIWVFCLGQMSLIQIDTSNNVRCRSTAEFWIFSDVLLHRLPDFLRKLFFYMTNILQSSLYHLEIKINHM